MKVEEEGEEGGKQTKEEADERMEEKREKIFFYFQCALLLGLDGLPRLTPPRIDVRSRSAFAYSMRGGLL